MLSKTDIANLTVGRLGQSTTILDLDSDQSNIAKILRRQFQSSLDTLCERHPWGHLTKYGALVLLGENPGGGFGFSYEKPADCLIIRQIAYRGEFPKMELYEDEKQPFEEIYNEGNTIIYTDVQYAHAKYTVRVTDAINFPTHFGRALSAQLAMDSAPSIITNNYPKMKQALLAEALNDISLGISHDIARQPAQRESLSPYIRARF